MDVSASGNRITYTVMEARVRELIKIQWSDEDILRYLKSSFYNVTRDGIRDIRKAIRREGV